MDMHVIEHEDALGRRVLHYRYRPATAEGRTLREIRVVFPPALVRALDLGAAVESERSPAAFAIPPASQRT
jgi:hypothetical protein